MVFRASKAKPSQLDRCLTASPPDVFVLSNAQISSFRPLVRPIFLHNFLTKYPYNPIVVPWVPACLARHHSNLQSGFMMLDARALSVLSCANRLRRWPLGSKRTCWRMENYKKRQLLQILQQLPQMGKIMAII